MGHVSTRGALAAALLSLAFAAPASAVTELNVIPHGQTQPGSAFLQQPGLLPADTQARMYDRLTPLYRSITPAVLQPSQDGQGYFKSARLITSPTDPELRTDETVTGSFEGRTVTARIRRDAYGVPHVYSASDDGVIFGAGHVLGEDRSLLINQARTNGIASLIDLPGAPGIELVLGLYDFQPSQRIIDEVTRQQTAALQATEEGRKVLRDIDLYLVGLNTWRAAKSPTTKPYTRTDIYAVNGIKAQFLGQGGGGELGNDALLSGLRSAMGDRRGNLAYQDLRLRQDPEHTPTTRRRASYNPTAPILEGRGAVTLRRGSFRSSAVRLPATSSRAQAAAVQRASRHEASNILLVSGSRSATGRPLFVGGPQIGYNYPGLTLEMGLYGPSIKVRGATSAPFPGYLLIGRGEDWGFSLTSAGVDIIDTYAEDLCGSDTRYRFRGTCRSMETIDAGTISKGGRTVRATFRRTVHGPVIGYGRDSSGRRVALTQKRSSYGRETTDQLLFRRLTFGQVRNAAQLRAAAALTPQTFNSFFANRSEIAFFTSGRLPTRPRGVNPDLITSGDGRFEWTGTLPKARHPQDARTSGTLVNWNNEPSAGWPASDDRLSQGSTQRNELLTTELAKYPRATLGQVLSAANAGATQDTRGKLAWPVISDVLDRGRAPSTIARDAKRELDRWVGGGATWVDADVDGTIDAAGVEILQVVWTPIARAAMCGTLRTAGCAALARSNPVENPPPGGQFAGWDDLLDKDLRRLLDRPVRGAFGLRYCGGGDVERCSRSLWTALDRAVKAAAQRKRNNAPSRWRRATSTAEIEFSPVPLVKMQYTNRPSGIHQVLQFAP